MLAIAYRPKVARDHELLRHRIGQSPELRISDGTCRSARSPAALLREGSISVRLLCVMLFDRYLKFFLEWKSAGPEPTRAPHRHRRGAVGIVMRLSGTPTSQRLRNL